MPARIHCCQRKSNVCVGFGALVLPSCPTSSILAPVLAASAALCQIQNNPGMWRSVKAGGQLSDMSNLSWAKNAVLIAAEREPEWEDRQRRAIDPSKCPEKGPVFSETSPPMRYFREADLTQTRIDGHAGVSVVLAKPRR